MTASEEGTPRGGPLAPLLANIYLDALDRELDNGCAGTGLSDGGGICDHWGGKDNC